MSKAGCLHIVGLSAASAEQYNPIFLVSLCHGEWVYRPCRSSESTLPFPNLRVFQTVTLNDSMWNRSMVATKRFFGGVLGSRLQI